MEHITNVLVYSNRCEVLDSHVFTVGDRGFPHIRLKFIYMFGAETLQGKQLELKYILPDKSYQVETISVTGENEVLFPIHYSVFVNGGWTTLKITIVEGTNRITLDDIVIKTKKIELGKKFENKKIEELIQAEIVAKTKEIKEEGEKQKKEIIASKEKALEEIENKRKALKGDKGEQGLQGLRGERGHNSVIVSETEPNKAEYDVWIKPTENGLDIETLLQQGSNDNNKLIKGTGSPKGVVQAEVNTLYIDKAKTNGAYLWLKIGNNNTEWKVIKGDTGTIEFTSTVLNGKVRIRRIDDWVILNFGGLQWDLFGLKRKAEVNASAFRKSTYNGTVAIQLKLTNNKTFGAFALPLGLRSAYPIYSPLFHDSGVSIGSILVAPNSDSNMVRFNIVSPEYSETGYVDLRCSNIIYYTTDDYPEDLQNLIRGLTQ
ncbi:hypothetical protein [Fusobacterium periodonticum]|uniref:BppU N-terminal domain-containing protein n=1 Tax=Fusobacterium periodonticum D10 TaxID=620833 RepID=K1GH27_9FUSO|nr:hypothetical protein [Fusobacterium periodonticum]EKA93409.1 hypothetical protein FPOG_00314 [Fusobacterium periodonticum D10]